MQHVLIAVWLGLLAAGIFVLADYSSAPGVHEGAISRLPAQVLEQHEISSQTLLLYLHPKCPCSRATLRELNRLLAHHSSTEVRAIFYVPENKSEQWAATDLWESCEQLCDPVIDRGGAEAKRLHVTTSGHVMLLTGDGQVKFSGGITAGRGHEGDSVGWIALDRLLRGHDQARSVHPVYGCPIHAVES